MRVIMTGGGTGGHIVPAIAIADMLKQNIPDVEIIFVGTERGLENELVPRAGYELKHVDVRGISRSLSPSNIKALYLAWRSPKAAQKIIKEFGADLAIGTGGYVCWPVLKGAAEMGIPTMVHESNAYAGLAVKQLQKHVDRILLNFEETKKYLKITDKAVCVGNPISKQYGLLGADEARKRLSVKDEHKFVLLSYGGSLGAKVINDMALELIRDFVSKNPDVMYIHATGRVGYDEFMQKYRETGLDKLENVRVSDYIYDMPECLTAADLVISRAGAMTVSELAIMKKAAIMIPSPNVTDNHQYKNAKMLADSAAVMLIEEKELTNGRIVKAVNELKNSPTIRKEMREAIAGFAKKDANRLILNEITDLVALNGRH